MVGTNDRSTSGKSSGDNTVKVLLALTLLAPPLCLGAVHPPVLMAVVLCGAAAFLAALRHKRLRSPRLDIVSVALLGMTAFTALQLAPLPSGLVEWLSPAVFAVRSRALYPLGGEVPAFMPLSLDVSLTAMELVKLFLYLCVYWTCQTWIRYKGSRFVVGLVALSGALCAAVLLGHRVLLLDLVYGFYKPIHLNLSSGGRISAPLLNENHMAALLGMGASMAIGLALELEDRTRRILAIAGSALIGGAMLLTFSRGGIVAFVLGQLLFLVLRLLHRTRKRAPAETGGHLGWVPLGLAASLGLGFFSAQDVIIGEFLTGDASKIDMARAAWPLIRDFWTTGVGRGAFWVGFAAYDPQVSISTATHAENIVVQLLSDYGLVVGTAVLAAFLVLMVRELRDVPQRPTRAAALASLVAFGVHNLVDFSVEVAGVAVVATACLAVLRFGGLRATAEASGAVLRLPRSLGYTLVGLSVCSCALLPLVVMGRTVDEDERRMQLALREGDPAPFAPEALREVLSRHPADAYVPLVVGVRAFQRREGNPLPWLARAIEVSPHSAPAHMYVGLSLLRAGRLDQGLLELRLAANYAPYLRPRIAERLVERYPAFDITRRIAVTDAERRSLWPSLADALAARNLTAETAKADEAILAIDPHAPRSLARHALRLAETGQMDKAFEAAATLSLIQGYEAAGVLLTAQLHRSLGEHAEAVKILEKQARAQPRHTGVLTELAWARLKAGDRAGAIEAAVAVRNLAETEQARAAGYALEAELEAAAGHVRTAMARLRDAHNLDQNRTHYLWRLVDLAQVQGDEASLVDALRKISAVDPADERARTELNEIQERHRKQSLLDAPAH